MNKKILLLSALIIALFAGVSEIAAQTSKNKPSDSGVFYKITGKKLKKPSYLLGTFHLICQKDLFPLETVKTYISQTEKLMLEIDLSDPAVIKKATDGAKLPDGKTAKDYMKAEDYAKVDALFKTYVGVSFDQLAGFRPFATSILFIMSPKVIGCAAVPGYDKMLSDLATANKTPIVGLESIEDEFAALDAEPLEKQFAALAKIADDPDKSKTGFLELYRIYLTQNSADLYKFMEGEMTKDGGSTEKLLDERNAKWIPVIEKNITEKPSFIAVGGGHLGGKKGVINLLRKKGYKLTPIKL